MVETNVHYPTDINLLLEALRKTITLTADYATMTGLEGWRQSVYNYRQVKRAHRRTQKMKRSSSRDALKKAKRQQEIVKAHRDYVSVGRQFIRKSEQTLATEVVDMGLTAMAKAVEIQTYIHHAERQMEQIERRVIHGETIPHEEKVFSVFQPHTEWLSKGKAGVPVELGLKVCIVEDTDGYVLYHQVMQHISDDQIAIDLICETQARYPALRVCSFDKGFHSPTNQVELAKRLDRVVLPQKGRCNKTEQERQNSEAFKRYVALAVVARNIQKLGAELQQKIRQQEKRKRHRDQLAA